VTVERNSGTSCSTETKLIGMLCAKTTSDLLLIIASFFVTVVRSSSDVGNELGNIGKDFGLSAHRSIKGINARAEPSTNSSVETKLQNRREDCTAALDLHGQEFELSTVAVITSVKNVGIIL
jgi:hypothetical protein